MRAVTDIWRPLVYRVLLIGVSIGLASSHLSDGTQQSFIALSSALSILGQNIDLYKTPMFGS